MNGIIEPLSGLNVIAITVGSAALIDTDKSGLAKLSSLEL